MKDKKIAILWYGKEWQSTFIFLLWQNIDPNNITILDGNTKAPVPNNINTILWENYLDNLNIYDIIIKSPGISPYDEKILPFADKLTSQTQIFFQYYKWKVIWVTATKGKSTTSSIVYLTLQSAGYKVKFVGNIGKPVLEEIELEEKYDYIVYELSSYMLEWLEKKNYISILGNIYPDHLGWHNGFENYKNAKLNILKWSEYNIVNEKLKVENIKLDFENSATKFFGEDTDYYFLDGEFFVKWEGELRSKRSYPGVEKVFEYKWVKLLGKHNIENILSVMVVCDIIWIDYNILYWVLKDFVGLAHRMEYIGNLKGIEFYDDAISTTPESTIYAIETFWKQVGCIFLWGEDRGYDFKELGNILRKYNIKNIVLFPDSWEKIGKLLGVEFNILRTTSMKKAVEFAFENTWKWKVCLLSCASPSYSLWKNFEEKGGEFQKYVKKLGE